MISAKELRAIAKVMEDFGIARLKSREIELWRRAPKNLNQAQIDVEKPIVPVNAPAEPIGPLQHKVEQMASLLKMSDADLVDSLFPDTEIPEQEAG